MLRLPEPLPLVSSRATPAAPFPQLYTSAVPHEGYHILHRWGEAAKGNFFVFTSNVDGASLFAVPRPRDPTRDIRPP